MGAVPSSRVPSAWGLGGLAPRPPYFVDSGRPLRGRQRLGWGAAGRSAGRLVGRARRPSCVPCPLSRDCGGRAGVCEVTSAPRSAVGDPLSNTGGPESHFRSFSALRLDS